MSTDWLPWSLPLAPAVWKQPLLMCKELRPHLSTFFLDHFLQFLLYPLVLVLWNIYLLFSAPKPPPPNPKPRSLTFLLLNVSVWILIPVPQSRLGLRAVVWNADLRRCHHGSVSWVSGLGAPHSQPLPTPLPGIFFVFVATMTSIFSHWLIWALHAAVQRRQLLFQSVRGKERVGLPALCSSGAPSRAHQCAIGQSCDRHAAATTAFCTVYFHPVTLFPSILLFSFFNGRCVCLRLLCVKVLASNQSKWKTWAEWHQSLGHRPP